MENITIITDITAQKKRGRMNIFINGEYRASLSEEVISSYAFEKGKSISEEELEEAVALDNERYALTLAYTYLAYSARSEWAVYDHLLKKGIDEAIAAKTMSKLKQQGYVNDEDYCKRYLEILLNDRGMSKNAAKQKLYEKRISAELIDEMIEDISEETEIENAKRAYEEAAKKYAKEEKRKKREKIYRSLAQKGFRYEHIKKFLEFEESEEYFNEDF